MSEKNKESQRKDSIYYDLRFKIMVIGESKVGKTSIIKRYTLNKFAGIYLTTVGVDFQDKVVQIDDKKIRLQIWDTAGQERFRNVAKNYFHSSDGFLLVYDITSLNSFKNLNYWIEQIRLNAPENTKCVLVGNKSDLEKEREVKIEDAEEFAKKHNVKFFESSAKDGNNVNDIFEHLANEIYNEVKLKGSNKSSNEVLKKDSKKKKKCC